MKHLVINLILFWYLKVSIFIIHVKLTQQQINEILKRINEKADLIKSKQNTYILLYEIRGIKNSNISNSRNEAYHGICSDDEGN